MENNILPEDALDKGAFYLKEDGLLRRLHCRQNLLLPPISLPIYIRSCGYSESVYGWTELKSPEEKNFVQIFWCTQGIGEFYIGDKVFQLHQNEVIYRLPREVHKHKSIDPKTPWGYHWVAFDGPLARDFMLSYGYEQRPYYAGDCPVTLFSELETLVVQKNLYAQRHSLSILTEILALFGRDSGKMEHNVVQKFVDLVELNYSDSAFTVEAAAEILGMHRVSLYRIIEKNLCFSPKQYLQHFRIQKALSMLVETSASVKEIASSTGFNKVDWFCSLVERTTGYTPAAYRKASWGNSDIEKKYQGFLSEDE